MTEPKKYPPCATKDCEREGRYVLGGKYICDECFQHEMHKSKKKQEK